jgi:uncharacterized membrane protein (DUF4010 family)
MDIVAIEQLAIAAGLGLLVGFQREWTAPHVAGLRTFGLITVLGALAGIFSTTTGPWLIPVGLLSVALLVIIGGIMKFEDEDLDPGLTTQAAALVMYMAGVAIALDYTVLGIIVSGATAVLLHWKKPLHNIVHRIGENEIRAIIQLVLIAFVILPVLPNKAYDQFGVLNPFEIWLMVVLIVGLSLGGYICYKFFGAGAGALLAGFFGGIISSTATTVSYARRTRDVPELSSLAAVVIMIASTVVFGRVLGEVFLVAPSIVKDVFPPLSVMMLLMAVISAALLWFRVPPAEDVVIDDDPSELKAAIIFGLLYGGVLYAVALVKEHFDDEALYAVAALSGLTDMDAITLSTAQMINKGRLDEDTGWRMILVGSMSNLVFKAAAIGFLGSRQLLLRIAIAFGISFVGGVLLLLFWP